MKVKIKKPIPYASVNWTVADIESLRPMWRTSQCEEWLVANERYLRDFMIEKGWDFINANLDPE